MVQAFRRAKTKNWYRKSTLSRTKKILILDEATSGIDHITRKNLFNSIRKNYNDIRIIIISHNLNDYDFCDKIYEIKNGKLNNFNKNV